MSLDSRKYKFDYLVFVGRFSPYHSGHHHVATEALKLSKRLIFVIGSADRPRDFRNPFTANERISIINSCFKKELVDSKYEQRVYFAPQVDYTYADERWIAAIQASVQTIASHTYEGAWAVGHPPRVGIIGYNKDHSSYYLKKFPQWKLVEIDPINQISATDIREQLFGDYDTPPDASFSDAFVNEDHMHKIKDLVSECKNVREEYRFIQEYKKQWKAAPYPVTFNTVDAVVTQSGHILLVQRGAQPGEGLWALPGGFINQNETLKKAVIRELYEETKIDVPKPVLAGSIAKVQVFDDPHRSVRGRTITQAYHFRLNDGYGLPKIKGSDDAKKAKWFSLSDFMNMRNKLFEDHFCIATNMLGI